MHFKYEKFSPRKKSELTRKKFKTKNYNTKYNCISYEQTIIKTTTIIMNLQQHTQKNNKNSQHHSHLIIIMFTLRLHDIYSRLNLSSCSFQLTYLYVHFLLTPLSNNLKFSHGQFFY